MGVSAAGKTSVGTELAQRLGVPFVDADDLHPASNLAKMTAGEPLTDADRAPWLERVAHAPGVRPNWSPAAMHQLLNTPLSEISST